LEEAVDEVLPALLAVGDDVDARRLLFAERDQHGIALALREGRARQAPRRPEPPRLREPGGLGQTAGDRRQEHGAVLAEGLASVPSARRSRTMLTITPPTGIPNSWNQPMKRLITAIGSASGSVTKKNAVRVASVRSWRACPIRVRNPSRYSSSGSASFFFVKDSISRSVRASSRDFSILSTQSEYTLDMPRSRRAFAVGAVSKTYASYSLFSISSTMF